MQPGTQQAAGLSCSLLTDKLPEAPAVILCINEMALPSLPSTCLLALAAVFCVLQAEGRLNPALDCCPRFSSKPFPVNMAHRIQSYENQGPHMGCPLQAVVLVTKRAQSLCFRSDDANALQIVKIVNSRRNRKQKHSQRV